MFSNDEYMDINRAQTVSTTRRQVEILENWCKDFGSYFGWKVNISEKNSRMFVEVIADKCVYRILAENDYLGCIHHARQSWRTCKLTGGEFSFGAFARIMIHVLHSESSARK